MKSSLIIALTLAGAAFTAIDARAQSTGRDSGWLSVNLGSQAAPTTFTGATTNQTNVETGTVTTSYPIRAARVFDVGAGARIWRNLGVGVSLSYTTQDDTLEITTRVPHPFFFNQIRTVTGQQEGVVRQETGVHIQAVWMIPATSHVRIGVFGGPSVILVKQGVVTTVNVTETYPYDTATFASADAPEQSRNAVGFHAGVDGSYMFNERIGVGGVARFTRAHATFTLADGGTVSADLGGAQLAAGLRVRF